jgi:hypothetical protein
MLAPARGGGLVDPTRGSTRITCVVRLATPLGLMLSHVPPITLKSTAVTACHASTANSSPVNSARDMLITRNREVGGCFSLSLAYVCVVVLHRGVTGAFSFAWRHSGRTGGRLASHTRSRTMFHAGRRQPLHAPAPCPPPPSMAGPRRACTASGKLVHTVGRLACPPRCQATCRRPAACRRPGVR